MTLWFLESNEFVERWMSIARRKGIKMLGIEATLATEERAEARGVDYRGWREAMITGCLADASAMGGLARKLSRRLGGHSEVRLLSPSGTNFTFSLDDRRVEILDGRATEGKVTFLPAGHVGTTVDEESAEGTISYDSPIIFPEGRTEKLRLKVRRGKIVEYNAAVGASHFRDHLRSLGGDSDRFAFFGIGLNPLLRFGHTQDDKVLGAVELNFGESLSRGGRNRGRGDWWGIATRVSMAVGGHALMERGRLLV
jgi:leucyl aminopeptidase (aminopeptidase T)